MVPWPEKDAVRVVKEFANVISARAHQPEMAAERGLTVSVKITSLPQSTQFPMMTPDNTPYERLPGPAQFV
jgi:hypothetical protein